MGNVTQRESAFLAQVRPEIHRTGSEATVHTEARAAQNMNLRPLSVSSSTSHSFPFPFYNDGPWYVFSFTIIVPVVYDVRVNTCATVHVLSEHLDGLGSASEPLHGFWEQTAGHQANAASVCTLLRRLTSLVCTGINYDTKVGHLAFKITLNGCKNVSEQNIIFKNI